MVGILRTAIAVGRFDRFCCASSEATAACPGFHDNDRQPAQMQLAVQPFAQQQCWPNFSNNSIASRLSPMRDARLAACGATQQTTVIDRLVGRRAEVYRHSRIISVIRCVSLR